MFYYINNIHSTIFFKYIISLKYYVKKNCENYRSLNFKGLSCSVSEARNRDRPAGEKILPCRHLKAAELPLETPQ